MSSRYNKETPKHSPIEIKHHTPTSFSNKKVFSIRNIIFLIVLIILCPYLIISTFHLDSSIPFNSKFSSPMGLRGSNKLQEIQKRQYRNLIILPGHAVSYLRKLKDAFRDDSSWYLLPYQLNSNFPHLLTQHILTALVLLAADPEALLVISGGQTRKDVGPFSEAGSYYYVSQANGWIRQLEEELEKRQVYKKKENFQGADGRNETYPFIANFGKVIDELERLDILTSQERFHLGLTASSSKLSLSSLSKSTFESRIFLEEYARDSFENVLFSIARFFEATTERTCPGWYPEKITTVGFSFKMERISKEHTKALRFPLDSFRYIPLVPPNSYSEVLSGTLSKAYTLTNAKIFGTEEIDEEVRNWKKRPRKFLDFFNITRRNINDNSLNILNLYIDKTRETDTSKPVFNQETVYGQYYKINTELDFSREKLGLEDLENEISQDYDKYFHLDKAILGEKEALKQFKTDPYGCFAKELKDKKYGRDPFHRMIPYQLSNPSLVKLLSWCERELIPEKYIPWSY